MVDYSYMPCKNCKHLKKDHSTSYDTCMGCKYEFFSSGCCTFERMDNLPYIEWLYNERNS